jgi:hypothetical protein
MNSSDTGPVAESQPEPGALDGPGQVTDPQVDDGQAESDDAEADQAQDMRDRRGRPSTADSEYRSL